MGIRDRCFAAVLALCGAAPAAFAADAPAPPPPPAAASADASLPNAAELQRLARRAILAATGVRMHVGPVTVKEKLADGSYLVDVMLEGGRRVRGRLFRNRRRFRITVDRRDLYSREETVIIKKD